MGATEVDATATTFDLATMQSCSLLPARAPARRSVNKHDPFCGGAKWLSPVDLVAIRD